MSRKKGSAIIFGIITMMAAVFLSGCADTTRLKSGETIAETTGSGEATPDKDENAGQERQPVDAEAACPVICCGTDRL